MVMLLGDQTWSIILLALGIFGLFLYAVKVVIAVAAHIISFVVLHRKDDSALLEATLPAISIIKPLCGADDLLQENLESCFRLEYPKFELLFCVHTDRDPAIAVVTRLQERYPSVDTRVFIGGKKGILNPMVSNFTPAYDNANYDVIWLINSRIKVSSDILLDMVSKLHRPGVALVHQLPFTRHQKGFAATLDKVYFGATLARYYLVFGSYCMTGMSYLYKKSCLDQHDGLSLFGKYLSDDNYIAKALLAKGRALVSAFPAQQNYRASVRAYKDRMLRWQKLRFSISPFVAGMLEPLWEWFPLGLYAGWCAYYILGIYPPVFLFVHTLAWLVSDCILLKTVQNGPLPCTWYEYVRAWSIRQLIAVTIYLEALRHPLTVTWGHNIFHLSLGGQIEWIETK